VTIHLGLTEVVGGRMSGSEFRSPDGFFNGHSRIGHVKRGRDKI